MLRENLEWTDTWWEQANDAQTPRVLLFGDSITRDYHPLVQARWGGRVNVDRFTTSKFVQDPFFRREAALYLGANRYTAVHISHGLHGKAFTAGQYQQGMEWLVDTALEYCGNVVLAACTPVAVMEPKPAPHAGDTAMVLERNAVLGRLALQRGLALNDLYTLAENKFAWKVPDGTHFNKTGSAALAKAVAEHLEPYIFT